MGIGRLATWEAGAQPNQYRPSGSHCAWVMLTCNHAQLAKILLTTMIGTVNERWSQGMTTDIHIHDLQIFWKCFSVEENIQKMIPMPWRRAPRHCWDTCNSRDGCLHVASTTHIIYAYNTYPHKAKAEWHVAPSTGTSRMLKCNVACLRASPLT